MVNDGGRHVFVERDGIIETVADRTLETRNLSVAIKNIARACGDEIAPRRNRCWMRAWKMALAWPPCFRHARLPAPF